MSDVTAQFTISAGVLQGYTPPTGRVHQLITFTNNGAALAGPVVVSFNDMEEGVVIVEDTVRPQTVPSKHMPIVNSGTGIELTPTGQTMLAGATVTLNVTYGPNYNDTDLTYTNTVAAG